MPKDKLVSNDLQDHRSKINYLGLCFITLSHKEILYDGLPPKG
jgi:hypothetical protein